MQCYQNNEKSIVNKENSVDIRMHGKMTGKTRNARNSGQTRINQYEKLKQLNNGYIFPLLFSHIARSQKKSLRISREKSVIVLEYLTPLVATNPDIHRNEQWNGRDLAEAFA